MAASQPSSRRPDKIIPYGRSAQRWPGCADQAVQVVVEGPPGLGLAGEDARAQSSVARVRNPLANFMREAGSLFGNRPLSLVAGQGSGGRIEPATSGL